MRENEGRGKGKKAEPTLTRNSSKKEPKLSHLLYALLWQGGGWVDVTQQQRLPDHEEYAFKEVVYLLESISPGTSVLCYQQSAGAE